MEKTDMRIILADDHSLFRDTMVEYIRRSDVSASVLTASDMDEVMETLKGGEQIDLILLDLRMPGMDDFAGLKNLKSTYPDIPVALLSGLAEKEDIDAALDLGAAGYFSKTLSGREMLNGIKEIITGNDFISVDGETNEYMPSYFAPEGFEAPDSALKNTVNGNVSRKVNSDIKLTPRETQVMAHLSSGASNKEIANALDLQIVTVKLHVRGICRKLDAKNRTQAVLRAQQEGLVEVDAVTRK